MNREPRTPKPSSEPTIDWAALDRLRQAFLTGTAGKRDYWCSEADLASYDATFAQRIGWKWDFVLKDLQTLGWTPPETDFELLDWGCGSGIAARAFLDGFPEPKPSRVRFVDRSGLATRFAARRCRERFPQIPVTEGSAIEPAPVEPHSVVLLSHILTELEPHQTEALLERLHSATAVLWVEPGTTDASRALVAMREQLRSEFTPIAPCRHRGSCGLLMPGNEPHWCHHFARSPAAVFTDPFWGRFAHVTGIDLRSLPLSYLVLDRRPAPPDSDPRLARMLGRPRVLKAEVQILACRPDGKVQEHRLARRHHPDAFTAARKDRFPSLAAVEASPDGGDIEAEKAR